MIIRLLKYFTFLAVCLVQVYYWTLFTEDHTATQKEHAIEISVFLAVPLALSFLFLKKRQNLVSFFKGLFLASILGIFCGVINNEVQQGWNKKVINQLLKELEKYKASSGDYPRFLSDLGPGKLDGIPTIYYGLSAFELGYSVAQDSYEEYYLFVDLPHRKIQRYDSSTKTWGVENKGTPGYRLNFR